MPQTNATKRVTRSQRLLKKLLICSAFSAFSFSALSLANAQDSTQNLENSPLANPQQTSFVPIQNETTESSEFVAQADEGSEEEVDETGADDNIEFDEQSFSQPNLLLQANTGNPEDGPDADDEEEGPFTWSVESRSEYNSSENADFRETVEDSSEDVYWTDDRHTFAYSQIVGSLSYAPDESTRFNLSLAHAGLWGSDQLGYEARETGALRFYELNTVFTPECQLFEPSLTVGRQRFEIGAVPRDYMFSDTVDALVLNAAKDGFGLRVLAFDMFTANDLPEGVAFVDYVGGQETPYSLRGETNTIRHGVVLDVDQSVTETIHIDAAAYYFFALIGGGSRDQTGTDITERLVTFPIGIM